jgi:hypothetical protein
MLAVVTSRASPGWTHQEAGYGTRSMFERLKITSKVDLLDAVRGFDCVSPATGGRQV